MKLRILDDAVRLRLDRDEVEALRDGQSVSASTHFPGGALFEYRLAVGDSMGANLDGGVMTVTVPRDDVSPWATDDTLVSIRGESGPTSILVEKDFECLEPREGESQANRFPNPKATSD